MALVNTEDINVGVQAPVTKTKKDSDYLAIKGNAILAGKTDEEKEKLGCKSDTLHFQFLLGLASKKSTRRVSQNETKGCSTAVGVALVSDEDITVPVIDILKDKHTGIEPEDISYREVKAGELFYLSYYEFMYLIVRDEYAGVCCNGDGEKDIYFTAKMPAYLNGKTKLPTPTINMRYESIKKSIVNIDEKGADGEWFVKEPYAEKFGALIKKQTPKRSAGNKTATPKSTLVAVALKDILGVK